MTLRGFDVSNWQAGTDVTGLGADFVIVKATEGLSFTDRSCDRFVQALRRAGIPWGFYHFARSNDPAKEADYFISQTKGYFGEGIPVLDFEVLNSNGWIETFCRRVYERTRVYPWVYMSADYVNNRGYGTDWVKSHCALWLAGYPKNHTGWRADTVCPYAHRGWTLAAWQFTSSFRHGGISLDADYAYMSKGAWERYARGERGNKAEEHTAGSVTDNKWALARQVINGVFGDGTARKAALGARYKEVQACVDKLVNGSDKALAKAVIAGEMGNGETRRAILGSRYAKVQKVVNKMV